MTKDGPTPDVKKGISYAIQVLVAMVGGVLLGGLPSAASVLFGRVGPEHWMLFRILIDVPYSPLFCGSALLLGFWINRRRGDHCGQWVWVVGILWLGLGMISSYSPYKSHPWYNPEWCPPAGCSFLQQVYDNLFDLSGNRCGTSECLGEFLFTTPSFCAFAYSLGAFFGLRSTRSTKSALGDLNVRSVNHHQNAEF